MSDLDALLAGIVANPTDALRWLVMADWLEDHGQSERAELVRVHRELLRTCTATRETKARQQLHAHMMELMRAGVQPCLPTRTVTLPGGVEMRFSFIPPGSFLMGSPKSEAERQDDERRHLVTLTRGFWLGVSPVTQGQWVALMGARDNPSHFKGDEKPVDTVNQRDAMAYCAVMKADIGPAVRLPKEAEWEYAAKAGTITPFYWGDELNGTQANCRGYVPYGSGVKGPNSHSTSNVGEYGGLAPHPWGLVDVMGNVWEWCSDWYDSYPSGAVSDPVGPEIRSHQVFRGGCWSSEAESCRAANRGANSPDLRNNYLGFRLAADLSALA